MLRSALVALLLCAACEDPEPAAPTPWRVVDADADRGIQLQRGSEQRWVQLGLVRFPGWTPEQDLYRAHVHDTLREAAIDRELILTGADDAADLRGEGYWLNREMVRRGWARAAEGAPQPIVGAEDDARRERSGGWSGAFREEALGWLRRRADGVIVRDAPEPNVERRMRWIHARDAHGEELAFFEIEVPAEPQGPPTCRDRLRDSLGELPQAPTPQRVRLLQELFAGEELFRIVSLEPDDAGTRRLTCRRYAILSSDEDRQLAAGWRDPDGAQVLEYLPFEVRTGSAPIVELTAGRRERGEETTETAAEGVLVVRGPHEGGVVIGGLPWFSTGDACAGYLARTLRTVAPECAVR